MKISVEFNSIEEMQAFAREIVGEKKPLTIKELNETAKVTEAIINAAEEKEAAEKAAKKAAKKEEPAPVEEAPAKEEAPAATSEITETQVKVLLSEKLKAGKKAQVKELFGKYGVDKLSELIEKHPDKMAQIYKEAEEI
jgi:hypothetical protein